MADSKTVTERIEELKTQLTLAAADSMGGAAFAALAVDELEQAIAATLGSGTLTAEQVRECVQHVYHEGYSDGSVRRGAHIDETDWQAIADDLNAALGSGTCENVWAKFGKFKCSECAMEVNAISTNTTTPRPIAFCPNCGARIRKAVE